MFVAEWRGWIQEQITKVVSNEFLKLLIIPFLVKLVICSVRSGTKYLSFRLY